MDDEKMAYPFYEKSKELGLKVFSVHKGFASQSRTLGHFAHPGDLEKAAKDHPDLTFICLPLGTEARTGRTAVQRRRFL